MMTNDPPPVVFSLVWAYYGHSGLVCTKMGKPMGTLLSTMKGRKPPFCLGHNV